MQNRKKELENEIKIIKHILVSLDYEKRSYSDCCHCGAKYTTLFADQCNHCKERYRRLVEERIPKWEKRLDILEGELYAE